MKEIQFHPYLHYLPFHFPTTQHHGPCEEDGCRRRLDRLPEEIVSLIAVKVAETLEAPLEDLHTLRLCNKAMKRASSSHAVTNRFNLEHRY
jgi:hypothetical protein